MKIKKIKLFLLFFVLLILQLYKTGLALNENVVLNGRLRNDFTFFSITNTKSYLDILENRFILSKQTEDWKLYSDLRLYLYSGAIEEFKFNPIRMFIRYYSSIGDFTFGKTYVNFGNPGVFNPFEMEKNIDFTDLAYDKEGILAGVLEIPLSSLSGGQIYARPNKNLDESGYGFSLFGNITPFDFGLVANRKAKDKNLAGFYFKGDIELGVKGAYAFHFTEKAKKHFSEVNFGLDYSLKDFYIDVTGYYDEKGALRKEDYNDQADNDTFFLARFYLYNNICYKPS